MHGLSAPALWLLRRWTGYRLYHLLAVCFALVTTLVGLALPFWWLGEHAEAAAGVAGVIVVSLAYLSAATLVLAVSAFVTGRIVLGRIRRALRLSRKPI
jgi:hypothetical protein